MAEKNAAPKRKQTAIVLNTTQKQQKMEFCEVKKFMLSLSHSNSSRKLISHKNEQYTKL